ncbi:MAG: UDP-N-acetylmuramoyl-L-alanine--D-glutamate ligase [Candidatus Kapabacteria bacterium]|nr:UDP-N-acetylmuramoyl-L-alanine--D-glutamate ligase [Candidatus Kapabacteria bacterium]
MNYTVIGAGKSGIAAALLAKSLNNNVFLTESKPAEDYINEIIELEKAEIAYEFGGNTEQAFSSCDCFITCPGVLPSTWIISQADKRGIPVISEPEFASLFLKNPIIAITGTNGKTTTTTIITFILNNSGKKAIACGNIGLPLSSLVGNIDDETILVVEMSSFQLDRIDKFHPDVAMILNITPDHLYYHQTMDQYSEAKWKISLNQNENNLLILNFDDEAIRPRRGNIQAKIAYVSTQSRVQGAFVRDGEMMINYFSQQEEEKIMLTSEIGIPGTHNYYNSMCAALAARAFEVTNENIRDSLIAFQGVEHRLEHVRTLNGVDFINDSKATNVNSTWYALSSYDRPIVWIAGGRGDNNDYTSLNGFVQENVKAIVAIGEEQDAIFNHFASMVRCVRSENLEDSVNTAVELASEDDVVLFSPSCKSFDMFVNFEHRGESFKEIVRNL